MSPVYLTGVGAIAGGARGVDDVWKVLSTRGAPIQSVPNVDWAELYGRRHARRWSISTLMAVTAAREAQGADTRSGGSVGLMFTPTTTMHDASKIFTSDDPVPLHSIQLLSPNTAGSQVARELGVGGVMMSIEGACASSMMAIAEAWHALRANRAEVVYAGGADCQINPDPTGEDPVQDMFRSLRIVADHGDCRPFDQHRTGMISGPGAAVVRLERTDTVEPLAEILGVAITYGGKDFYAPEPDGSSIGRAIRIALSEAGLEGRDISLVVAHGTGTVANDEAEAAAIRRDIGAHAPVTSLKGRVGHTSYASGALNVVAAVKAIATGVIPPTSGTVTVDPAFGLDVVLEPRPWTPGPVACLSIGLGGANSCVIVGPPP